MFYDRRCDPKDKDNTMTLARSTDGGHSFRNYAWTDTPWDGQDAFIGDYTWLTAYNDRVYGAWTETIPKDKAAAGRKYPATKVRAGVADFSGG